jgi:hypothetical protein
MAAQKDAAVEGTVSDWKLSANRQHATVKKGNAYHVTALDRLAANPKSLGAPVPLDRLAYRYKPVDEWLQIFNDTWRWYRDFFYDANMHGRDWKKMGDTYRAWVPDLSSRADLNWLLSQMVGELCVSHTHVVDREPRLRSGHPARQRPGVGRRRPGRAAREGDRGADEADQGEAVHLRAEAGVPEEVAGSG